MEAEDDFLRPLAPSLYNPVDLLLLVPTDGLIATQTLLSQAGGRESGVFWYGSKDELGNGTVEYVVAPKQRMTWGNYAVTPEALAEIVNRLPDHWKPLAQVHSHPGLRVEHSSYDDQMVSSRRALSIVFPSYGRGSEPFPVGVGIHEWQNGYWHLLELPLAEKRVKVINGIVRVEDMR